MQGCNYMFTLWITQCGPKFLGTSLSDGRMLTEAPRHTISCHWLFSADAYGSIWLYSLLSVICSCIHAVAVNFTHYIAG